MQTLWLFLEHQTEKIIINMSILERLTLGMGLALFGLVTLYVLLFRSSIASSFPRILLRLALICIFVVTSAVSYFCLVKSLINPENEVQIASPPPLSEGRADAVRQLEKNREKKIQDSLDH
jgi:hypothetical protein